MMRDWPLPILELSAAPCALVPGCPALVHALYACMSMPYLPMNLGAAALPNTYASR